MDDLNAFLSCSADFKRITVPGGYVNARAVPKVEVKPPKRECRGTDYGEEQRKAEMNELMKVIIIFVDSKK